MKSRLIPRAIERARDILAKPAGGGLTIHNIELVERRTSFRLDRTIRRALQDIALRERITVEELCTAIDVQKPRALSLTVAVRIAVLQYYRDAATEAGHQQAGHGEAL